MGARVADLNRLESVQFVVKGNVVYVDFRVTKSARTAAEAFSVELPTWIPFNPIWTAMAKEPKPFTANCDRVNRVLHGAGYTETSYSFRRLFVNRLIDRFTEKGITEWSKVIQLTGHQQAKNVRGHYKIPGAERARLQLR